MNLLSCEQFFGLFEGQLRAFDVCGVVGLQQQGAAAHVCNPLFRQCGSLEKASGTFDDRQIPSDGIGDSESWAEFHSCFHASFDVRLSAVFFADFSSGFGHRSDFRWGTGLLCSILQLRRMNCKRHPYAGITELTQIASGQFGKMELGD